MKAKKRLIKITDGIWTLGSDVAIFDRWYEHKKEGRYCVEYNITSLCFVTPAKKYFSSITKAKAFVRSIA